MAVEKLSLSFDPILAERARKAAETTGRTLSGFVAEAVEYRLKLEEARALLGEWEREHGPVTEEELSQVKSKWRD